MQKDHPVRQFPLEASVGAAIRMAHLAYAQDLQNYLVNHEIPVGMWFYLRALWEEDGLTQKELSHRVGSTEPTTAQQLVNMEKQGYIARRRSTKDKRSSHVHLTAAGRALRERLLPYAIEVNATALDGISKSEIRQLREILKRVRENLARRQLAREETAAIEFEIPATRSVVPKRTRAKSIRRIA
jgi:DNA-binding MarR family transcriptional regulator